MIEQLPKTQAHVYELALRPEGIHSASSLLKVGRGNGYSRAMDALVEKGLCYWDEKSPYLLRARVANATPAMMYCPGTINWYGKAITTQGTLSTWSDKPFKSFVAFCYTQGPDEVAPLQLPFEVSR